MPAASQPVAPEGRELNPGPPRSLMRRDDLQLVTAAPAGGLYAILEERPQRAAEAREVQVVVGWQGGLPQ